MYMHLMLSSHWVTNHCGCCYYNEQYGKTALMMAADNGHGAIVTYLVEQGANKDLQNKVSIHLRKMMMMMMIVYMVLWWWVYVCMRMYVYVWEFVHMIEYT